MEEITLLYEEYKAASQRIEEYQNKHLSFYNQVILIFSGIIIFTPKDTLDIMSLLYVFPYLFIILLMLIYYHYHRTLIVQGHRKFLEDTINLKMKNALHADGNPLLFGHLSEKFIINPKGAGGNKSIYLFAVINLAAFIALILFCNLANSTWVHASIQLLILLFILYFWNKSTGSAQTTGYNEAFQRYKATIEITPIP